LDNRRNARRWTCTSLYAERLRLTLDCAPARWTSCRTAQASAGLCATAALDFLTGRNQADAGLCTSRATLDFQRTARLALDCAPAATWTADVSWHGHLATLALAAVRLPTEQLWSTWLGCSHARAPDWGRMLLSAAHQTKVNQGRSTCQPDRRPGASSGRAAHGTNQVGHQPPGTTSPGTAQAARLCTSAVPPYPGIRAQRWAVTNATLDFLTGRLSTALRLSPTPVAPYPDVKRSTG
jgi:hypothetical protein